MGCLYQVQRVLEGGGAGTETCGRAMADGRIEDRVWRGLRTQGCHGGSEARPQPHCRPAGGQALSALAVLAGWSLSAALARATTAAFSDVN